MDRLFQGSNHAANRKAGQFTPIRAVSNRRLNFSGSFAEERDFERTRKLLTSLTIIDLGGQEIAIKAARYYRTLR